MSVTIRPDATVGPTLNLSDGNAAQVFDLLGLHYDGDVGETSAEDLLGRVLLAQALLDVTADDEDGRPEVSVGRLIECGRRPGYLAEKLSEVHAIATWAHERQLAVWWS
jgi:hypothetical protein